jgi:hypothetical protein
MLTLRLVSLATLFLLSFPAIICLANEQNNNAPMAQPFVELMLYEAAQQAVEDGYATIIPEPANEEKKTATRNVEKNSLPAKSEQLTDPVQ